MNTYPAAVDFTVTVLDSHRDPRLCAFRASVGGRFQCGTACRCDIPDPAPEGPDDWAVALESEDEIVAAAWATETAEGPHLMVIAGFQLCGEAGVEVLLEAARVCAVKAGQRQLMTCVPLDQPLLLDLLERAGFQTTSAINYGGIAEINLRVSDTV